MSTTIFGETSTPVALSLGKSILTIGSDSNSYKLAVNSLNYSYDRTLTPYYPINMDEIGRLLVAGEPIGRMSLSYLMGASKNLTKFLENFSDVCSIKNNSISIKVGNTACANTVNFDTELWTFQGCLITGVGGQVSRSQNGNLCIGSVNLMFVNLKYN